MDGWVTMGREFQSALIMDPVTGAIGTARTRQGRRGTRLYLQLAPGESLILKTETGTSFTAPDWRYLKPLGDGIALETRWKVEFLQGGPILPKPMEMDSLVSWTKNPDREAERFAGTARYSATLELPARVADEWLLDLGKLRDSARVSINGQPAGTVWSLPFQLRVGKFLRPGRNTIEIEVTNLSSNRIRDLDRRKVGWKKFHDANIVSHEYKKFDASKWPIRESGLLGREGRIHLVPCKVLGSGQAPQAR